MLNQGLTSSQHDDKREGDQDPGPCPLHHTTTRLAVGEKEDRGTRWPLPCHPKPTAPPSGVPRALYERGHLSHPSAMLKWPKFLGSQHLLPRLYHFYLPTGTLVLDRFLIFCRTALWKPHRSGLALLSSVTNVLHDFQQSNETRLERPDESALNMAIALIFKLKRGIAFNPFLCRVSILWEEKALLTVKSGIPNRYLGHIL